MSLLVRILISRFSKNEKYPTHRRKVFSFHLVATLCWLLFFISTAKWTYVEYSLDAEDPHTAQIAYENLFQISDVADGVALAYDSHQIGTVRFYAACKVADILATNDEPVVANTLARIDETKLISAFFYGTNALNQMFFVSGMPTGPHSVKEIIQKRLFQLKES
jgi:hypothetical protein